MELPFVLNGVAGLVRVDYRRNTEPAAVGCPPDTADYPSTALDGAAWDEHLDTLRERHPLWHFAPGLADLS